MARAVRKSELRQVPLSEAKDDLSRLLREAEKQVAKPAGVLIGFASENDWFDYVVENDPRFLRRIEEAQRACERDAASGWKTWTFRNSDIDANPWRRRVATVIEGRESGFKTNPDARGFLRVFAV